MYVLLTRQPNEGKLINGKKSIEAAKNYVHIFLGKKGLANILLSFTNYERHGLFWGSKIKLSLNKLKFVLCVSKPTTAVAAAQSVCSLSVLFQIQVSQKRFQTNSDSAKKVYRPPGVVGGWVVPLEAPSTPAADSAAFCFSIVQSNV